MHTDKETYLIFTRCPEFVSELSGLPHYGESQVKSVNIKAINRTADGVEFPLDPTAPIRVVEVQFQRRKKKGNVYRRILASMVLIQEENQDREIEGVIFFGDESCDPKTMPWCESGLIHCCDLGERLRALQSKDPRHPLVSVFKPVFEEDTEALVESAKEHYHNLTTGDRLTPTQSRTLADVFEHWMLERLPTLNRKEIAMILDLPDVRQTVCGQELLQEGREEGAVEMLMTILSGRFKLPKTLERKLRKLSNDKLTELAISQTEFKKLQDLRDWIEENAK